jgi:hypothetical protein
MLNPSTADASTNDPTLARCIGFTQRHGFGMLTVVNLYALRATDPAALAGHPDPIGPHNDTFIALAAEHTDRHIAAWGAHATATSHAGAAACRAHAVTAALTTMLNRRGLGLWNLGTTSSGQPRHPLYLPADAPLSPHPAPQGQPKVPR